MFRRICSLKWIAIVGVTLFTASLADANPARTPPPPTPTLAGRVYYFDGVDVRQMNANGTTKTPLFAANTDALVPSSQMYGDERWWLANLYDVDGVPDLYATKDGQFWIQITSSGIVDNGDGTETFTYFWGTPSWSNDGLDSFCSIQARRGTRLLGSSDTSTVKAVIYRFEISASDLEAMSLIGYDPLIFDGDLLATPVVITGPTLIEYALNLHHWSPDGNQIAFTNKNAGDNGPVLRVVDVSNVHLTGPVPAGTGLVLFNNGTPNGVVSVQWSPNGQRIAFSSSAQVYTVTPISASSLITVTSGFQPHWSPDSLHLTYLKRTTTKRSTLYDIATIPAGGGSIVNLTTDGFVKTILGWRN